MIYPIIAVALLGALALSMAGAALQRYQSRWTRICMCSHVHEFHRHDRQGSDCSQCGCWQWRPLRVTRRQPPGEPPPLPRRKPVPGLPSDGRPLDDYELERLRRVIDPGKRADSKGSQL
jgi:hypothetical protein